MRRSEAHAAASVPHILSSGEVRPDVIALNTIPERLTSTDQNAVLTICRNYISLATVGATNRVTVRILNRHPHRIRGASVPLTSVPI